MKKKSISLLLLFAMVVTCFQAVFFTATALDGGKTELTVTWNAGYVGSNTHNSSKNKIAAGSAIYKYSDIITVPKAGTKISFVDDSCAGDSGSFYVSCTVYVFSTWKKSGSDDILDLDGANIAGTYQYAGFGQAPVDPNDITKGMRYEFVTDHDDQAIRISYRCTASDTETPKVYAEATDEPSTLEALRAEDFTAVLEDDGTISNLNWYFGYIGSAANTNGSAKEVRLSSTTYAVSALFTVPKAGTRITYTLSCTPNANFAAFARYKKDGERYVYETGFSAADETVRSGSNPYTYSYVTSSDNEVLRISCRFGGTITSEVAIPAPVTVNWKYTGEPGTGSEDLKTEWPDAELLSPKTGAPLIGEEVPVTWTPGYVGSQYHDSKKFMLSGSATLEYYYTNIFTIPKAGMTVYFFDQSFTDFNGGTLASTSALTVSHWNRNSFDESRVYLTGCDVYSILLTPYYRVYAYTATEDNEQIRLCLRYATKYAGEEALTQKVYLVSETDFAAMTEGASYPDGGGLKKASYTDASGDTVEYRYFLPVGYDASKQYSLVFDGSEDGKVAEALADKWVRDSIVIACHEDSAKLLRLLDEVVEHYPVKVSDLLFVGGDDLAQHVATYENIRLAQAFLYTGSGSAPELQYAAVRTLSEFESVEAAGVWLIGEYDDYYTVLEGATMYAIGDSYFGGSHLGQHQTWVNLIGYEYGMTFHNFGIGGNTVATYTPLTLNQPPMSTRYTELPTDGDIYFVEGGRNDRHYSVPFGTNDSTDISTYKGALNVIISYLREKAPDALIVLVTPWSYKTETGYLGTNDDYADAMKELVTYYNDKHVVCLYAADSAFSGINMSDPACRAEYCIASNDVSHLNANGMYMVKDRFEGWIAGQYAALRGLALENAADADRFYSEAEPEETTAEESTDGTPGSDTGTGKEEGGCRSALGNGSFIALALLLLCCPVLLKKTKSGEKA